ncbi:MAG: hypothetical protein AMXMBFR8_29410 [Nevskiales bacterium]
MLPWSPARQVPPRTYAGIQLQARSAGRPPARAVHPRAKTPGARRRSVLRIRAWFRERRAEDANTLVDHDPTAGVAAVG